MTDRFHYTTPLDPLAQPLVQDLIGEYERRYGDIPGRAPDAAATELYRYPPADFAPPHGSFVLLLRDGQAIAGGAFKRLDDTTAELKRMWTDRKVRRQGLARRVLEELEAQAERQGYRKLYLTTGFRQPEAKGLYLSAGYRPLFHEDEDLAARFTLPFEKDLGPRPAGRAPLGRIAFLTPGNYDEDAPRAGLEDGIALFAHAEALGFDGAWVRQRHLERGVSSAAVFLAAASQHTSRIELGTAVIQMGYENPFRLAEDLATVDALSGGRVQAGLSAGPPPHAALLGERLIDPATGEVDYSHARVLRMARNLEEGALGDDTVRLASALGQYRPRLQPVAPGLRERLWYGGGSLRSAEWSGRHGFHMLLGNVSTAEEGRTAFDEVQAEQLRRHRAAWEAGAARARPRRVALGRVILPLDGADAATRERLRAYVAGRDARTRQPNGPRNTVFAPDIIGFADEIVARLQDNPLLQEVDELRLELPYDLPGSSASQLLRDFAQLVAPALGWQGRAADRPQVRTLAEALPAA